VAVRLGVDFRVVFAAGLSVDRVDGPDRAFEAAFAVEAALAFGAALAVGAACDFGVAGLAFRADLAAAEDSDRGADFAFAGALAGAAVGVSGLADSAGAAAAGVSGACSALAGVGAGAAAGVAGVSACAASAVTGGADAAGRVGDSTAGRLALRRWGRVLGRPPRTPCVFSVCSVIASHHRAW
jgi:hypothetical protein